MAIIKACFWVTPLVFLALMIKLLFVKRQQVYDAFTLVWPIYKKQVEQMAVLVSRMQPVVPYHKDTIGDLLETQAILLNEDLSIDERLLSYNRSIRLMHGIFQDMDTSQETNQNGEWFSDYLVFDEIDQEFQKYKRYYNGVVTDYNNAVNLMPTSLMAIILRFKEKPIFE